MLQGGVGNGSVQPRGHLDGALSGQDAEPGVKGSSTYHERRPGVDVRTVKTPTFGAM